MTTNKSTPKQANLLNSLQTIKDFTLPLPWPFRHMLILHYYLYKQTRILQTHFQVTVYLELRVMIATTQTKIKDQNLWMCLNRMFSRLWESFLEGMGELHRGSATVGCFADHRVKLFRGSRAWTWVSCARRCQVWKCTTLFWKHLQRSPLHACLHRPQA